MRAVRAMMALRANVLAKGYSGIRRATLERLIEALNARVHPVVPSRGSVGASGDLAPLAHLSLVLIGEGHATVGDDPAVARRRRGARARRASRRSRSSPRKGWRSSTARRPRPRSRRWRWSAPSGWRAPPTSARRCRSTGCAARVTRSRRGCTIRGRIPDSAPRPTTCCALLQQSPINASHANCGRVQDAYSMRCAPQVHGAARDAFAHARRVLEIEANAATDNPMVFADSRRASSRAATSTARRWRSPRICSCSGCCSSRRSRTAVGSAGQPGAERAAAVPHARQRAALGLHDGAGHRRGAGVRAQDTRASGERRHDSRPRPTARTTSA